MAAGNSYTISDNGVHIIRIQEEAAGSATNNLTDAKFFELVNWLQTEGIIGTTNLKFYVTRPQSEITP